ncbi:MAG: calcium/sodium antiporter, partial [Proteobacteria bacterium]|nr:calcium/sodium antiporter [Pseudomonadota bacterium]
MISVILLLVGFVLLIKGADILVDGATSLARRFNVSDLVVGLTVVAFGTSCPELFVNLLASARGNTDIAIGNVLGSNIANVFLVLGATAAVRPLVVGPGTVSREIPASLFAAVLLWVLAADPFARSIHVISRVDGLVFLGLFSLFLVYTYSISRDMDLLEDAVRLPAHGPVRSVGMVVAGLVLLALGGQWIVDSAVKLALALGLSESVVGLTIVAVGTSLPEMATSVMAAFRGNSDIAVGNIIGSNIFN